MNDGENAGVGAPDGKMTRTGRTKRMKAEAEEAAVRVKEVPHYPRGKVTCHQAYQTQTQAYQDPNLG